MKLGVDAGVLSRKFIYREYISARYQLCNIFFSIIHFFKCVYECVVKRSEKKTETNGARQLVKTVQFMDLTVSDCFVFYSSSSHLLETVMHANIIFRCDNTTFHLKILLMGVSLDLRISSLPIRFRKNRLFSLINDWDLRCSVGCAKFCVKIIKDLLIWRFFKEKPFN